MASPNTLAQTLEHLSEQARSMFIDAEHAPSDDENVGVLKLTRRPRGIAVPGSTRVVRGPDVSEGTLHVEQHGDVIVMRLNGDSRVRRFGALSLTSPRSAAPARQGQIHVGKSPLDLAFRIEGSAFATLFLRQAERALMQLSPHRCRLSIDRHRVEMEVTLAGAEHDVRRVVAALFVLWRFARPLRARGVSAPSSTTPTPQQPPRATVRKVADKNAAERLTAWVDAATTPYSGSAARIRDTVQARVSLDGYGFSDMGGTLVFGFSTLRRQVHEIGLRATLELPREAPTFHLAPRRGWRGLWAKIVVDGVGDAELDKAYVIRLGETKADFILGVRTSLLRVVTRRPTIHSGPGRLVLQFEHLRTRERQLHDDIGVALDFWRVFALASVGLHTPGAGPQTGAAP